MEEVEVNKKEEEEVEEEVESVAVASVPSTSVKMPDLGPTSLAVPVISLFCLVLVVIGIGSIKGLYRRCRPGAEEPRPRPRSRASSGDSSLIRSKRSSALRRQRKLDKEEDNVYETFRLAPLVEVIQASPTMARLGPGGLFALTGGRENSGESEYSTSNSMCYSENTSNVSAPSSSLSAALTSNLKPALSVPRPQQLQFADSTPSPQPPPQNFPACSLASSESLEPKMQPVGSFLCGTVRVSVQREKERKREVEVEESPAYLPTTRQVEPITNRPLHHLHHLPVLDNVADSVAGARQARGLPVNNEEKWIEEEG